MENYLEYLPDEMHHMIFQHLSGRDLLVLSEVSRTMNYHVKHGRCMDKIVFKIDGSVSAASIREVFRSGDAHYRNLKLFNFPRLCALKLAVIDSCFPVLTTLTIRKTDFSCLEDFMVIMRRSEHFRELTLDQVYIRSVNEAFGECNIMFPKLRTLNLSCCHAVLYHQLFKNCTSLERFSIKAGGAFSMQAQNSIRHILTGNPNMKVLGIHFNVFGRIFSCDSITDTIRMKLRKFCAKNINISHGCIRRCFQSFLLGQISTLEEFSIDNWMGVDVMKMLFLMPRLRNLTLKGFHHYECESVNWSALELHQNGSIEDLNLYDISANVGIFKCVISGCKNLKRCSFFSLNDEMIEYLAAHCVKLECVRVEKLFTVTENPLEHLIEISAI